MASPRQSRPPAGFNRVSSMSSSSSGYRGQPVVRTPTRSSVSGSFSARTETSRSEFQDQLCEMCVAVGVPMALQRSLLSLPNQRAAPTHPSDKMGAEAYLMSLRPKRILIGKSSKSFPKDEVMLALDKAIGAKQPTLLVEGLIQLAETTGASTSDGNGSFTKDKKGHAIPTLDYLFTKADHSGSVDVWRLFLGRVSQRALDAALASALKDRTDDVDRVKSLLEHGANPELCQDRILELVATGSESLIEILFLSPLVENPEFLSQGLVRAVNGGSLKNTSILLLRGADGNFGQGSALRSAVSAERYDLALAIVTMAATPVSSSTLDDAVSLIGQWIREAQKPFLKVFLYAGASGPRTSKAVLPFITSQDQEVTSHLTECSAFRHSSFPAPRLFQYAIDMRNFALALDVLRSSNNRSFSDYASTGVHLQLIHNYSEDTEECHKVISELLTLGVSGDYTSQMLIGCCAPEHLDSGNMIGLIDLLLRTGAAKVNYQDGKALNLAVDKGNLAAVNALMTGKPTKKILSSAVARANSGLSDSNAAKLDVLSTLINGGGSGPIVDEELVSVVDKSPQSLKKVKVLLKGASLDYAEGKAIVKAIELERFDLIEAMLALKTPQFMTFTSIWSKVRKLFALAENNNGQLPYSLQSMLRTFELLHGSAKSATPANVMNDLLVDATKCTTNSIALSLSRLFLSWGATPNHAAAASLQACIKRSDTKTLAALLEVETSKSSLKYAFMEALTPQAARHEIVEILIAAGMEKAPLDAALPNLLREDPYDGRTASLVVGAGATLHSSFGENLVPPALNLDMQVIEKLLSSVPDGHHVLLPLKAILSSRNDWQNPDGESLPMVKLLLRNCSKGTWADLSFVTGVKSCNQHFASLFTGHLTSDNVYSDALQEFLVDVSTPLNTETLSMTQYLLKNGARGNAIDSFFVSAARSLQLDWITALYPYISDRSVALSAFDVVERRKDSTAKTQGSRLEILQFLLQQGLDGPMVNDAFVKAASVADLSGMDEFLKFVTSKDAYSQSLDLLAKSSELLTSREGLAAVELLIKHGASNASVAHAARVAASSLNLVATRLIVGLSGSHVALHAGFQGIMEHPQPLSNSSSRNILFFLLENGLNEEDAEQIARLAAGNLDLSFVKALAPVQNSKALHVCAIDAISLQDKAWLSTTGLEFIDYLIGKGVSTSAINRLLESASEALHLRAVRILLPAAEDQGKAVELAFGAVVSNNERWTSAEGLPVVEFLLQHGAHGPAVEKAASYAASTSNYDALEVFLKCPAAGSAIPAAFKALTRKSGQMSTEQLTIARTLVKEGVSTKILAIAAIEMAKISDLEGLKVLSGSPRFRQVADDVLRALLSEDNLWRTPEGNLITRFLIEKGASIKMIESAASKAAASLDIDALRNVLGSNSPFSVVESAFRAMTGIERGWLCPEGIRVAEHLLLQEPSEDSVGKAFVQASHYLYFDAVKLLEPSISDFGVFNEALKQTTESDWLSELHLVQLLLEAGAQGDAVELALIKGAQALNLPSLELLSSKVDRPELYTKALSSTLENTSQWRRCLDVIEFLLEHGATGEPVDKAYLLASEALDLPAIKLLYPYVSNTDIHSKAFGAAAANESWQSPNYLEVLTCLQTKDIASDVVRMALVAAAQVLNVDAVELLSQNADETICTQAFTAATRDIKKWTSEEGTKVVEILAQKGAHGDSVDDAFIQSTRLFRLDIVLILEPNIEKENFGCLSLALDALLSHSGPEDSWVSNQDALETLQILVSRGANGDSAHGALVLAAQYGNIIAVEILAKIVDDPQTFTAAFQQIATTGTLWLDSGYFDLVALLLTRGNADESVHAALISAVLYVLDGVASEELLQLILEHGADVNFDNGTALQVAAQNARIDIFEMLLQKGPDPHSLYMALQAALSSGLDEETVFAFFKAVTSGHNVQTIPDVNEYSDLGLPLIFYCLIHYPTCARLATEICELHVDLSATMTWDIYEDKYDDPVTDMLPPLLLSVEKDCSDDVINVLLTFGADVNYLTEEARISALMLAAGKGRASIVSTLIDRGASVIQKDSRDRTPLCHGARNGNIATMQSILKKNPPRNDGSLHEAARELNANAVKLLVRSAHDIHFPSAKHGGRTPLCELCLTCKGSQDPVALDETLNELKNAKAEPLRKSRGRTALFMAMENAHPGPVVTALIAALLWQDLNDQQNVYEEGDHFYSPTMYVKKGITRQPEAVAIDLLERLVDLGATDRYYAKERMKQPIDAVGMPQRILDLDHKNWIRSSRLEQEEEDFTRKLRRQEEEVANRQLLSQRQHLMIMEQRENLGQQQSAHVLDSHLLNMKLKDREHTIGLSHQDEAYDHRLAEMAAANQIRLNIEAAQFETKSGMQEKIRDAELRHYTQTQDKKLTYLGEEQTMKYNMNEAQQQLRLGGIEKELGYKRELQQDEIQYQEKMSDVERDNLEQKLDFANKMNTGRIDVSRELGNLDNSNRQNKFQVENQTRQAQLQCQRETDRERIYTGDAMNQQAFARSQNVINTQRAQGKIELDTRAGLSEIETSTMYDKIQMTQQDRGHRLATEHRLGQIQNETLADRYQLQQADRNNLLDTEQRMGAIQNHNLQKKVITELDYLQATNREKLGYQQATDQQRIGFQRTYDTQKLQTIDQEGNIQNKNLANKQNLQLQYQNQSGRMKLGQQYQSQNMNLNYQAKSAGLEIKKQGYLHGNRMEEMRAKDQLGTRDVQRNLVTQQMKLDAARQQRQLGN